MDRFEFVMVLMSIIVGLGVTELLTNVARQFQERGSSKPYWLHSVLVALVFLAFLQQWWESWDERQFQAWTFPIILLMLGGPIVLYIISRLLYPKTVAGTDMRDFYYANAPIAYAFACLSNILSTLYRPLSFGHSIVDADNIASAVLLLCFFVLAVVRSRRVHEFLVPAVFAAMLADVLLFHLEL